MDISTNRFMWEIEDSIKQFKYESNFFSHYQPVLGVSYLHNNRFQLYPISKWRAKNLSANINLTNEDNTYHDQGSKILQRPRLLA
ncbi:MAG: hypothetical protein GF313_03860 [Caldithrix sp.]|nr:hypothetical protein [Caldithrix sp.]